MLIVPCPLCGDDVEIGLEPDGDDFRAPGLLPVMNEHVTTVHAVGVSGM